MFRYCCLVYFWFRFAFCCCFCLLCFIVCVFVVVVVVVVFCCFSGVGWGNIIMYLCFRVFSFAVIPPPPPPAPHVPLCSGRTRWQEQLRCSSPRAPSVSLGLDPCLHGPPDRCANGKCISKISYGAHFVCQCDPGFTGHFSCVDSRLRFSLPRSVCVSVRF